MKKSNKNPAKNPFTCSNNKFKDIYKPIFSLKDCDKDHIKVNDMEDKAMLQDLWSQNCILCAHILNDCFIVGLCR